MKVIYISVDTFKQSHLGCYGYERDTTPNIDSLAKDGVVFENAYNTDSPTIPSYSAFLSGQIGTKTGCVTFNPYSYLPDQLTCMPQIVAEGGSTTAMASTLYWMRKEFTRGFHYYMNPCAGDMVNTQTLQASQVNAMAVPWIKQNYEKDFFLFIHYWDPHCESSNNWMIPRSPAYAPRYPLPPSVKNRYYEGGPIEEKRFLSREGLLRWHQAHRDYVISCYDTNIRYVDDHVGEVMKTVQEVGIAEDVMVIVTSDHGEILGEDFPMGKNLWDHLSIYEPEIKVPLVIRYPKELPRNRRVNDLVQSTIDLSATILDFFDLPKPKEFDGISLMPLAKGASNGVYHEVFSETGFVTAKRCIVTKDRWKLIKTYARREQEPEIELFNLKEDPVESRNLSETACGKAERLEYRMEKWVDRQLAKVGNMPDPLRVRAMMGRYDWMIMMQKWGAVPYFGYIWPVHETPRPK